MAFHIFECDTRWRDQVEGEKQRQDCTCTGISSHCSFFQRGSNQICSLVNVTRFGPHVGIGAGGGAAAGQERMFAKSIAFP